MSEPRSPRDRLRAVRAGRVSQLLNPTPDDGLPPTEPPRLTLNGKPVTTGAAFDAVIESRHSERIRNALPSLDAPNSQGEPLIKFGDRSPKAPNYINQLSPHQQIAMGNAITAMLGLTAVTGATAVYFGVPGATYPEIYASRNQNEGLADVISRQFASDTASSPSQHAPTLRPVASNDNSPHLSQFERSSIEISVGDSIDLSALFRRGNEVTQRKNDYIAEQFKDRLDQCFDMHNIDAESEHTHGGSDPARKERYIQDPRITSTRGSGSTDGSVRFRIGGDNYFFDFQTHDQLADGNPTLRESNNLKKLLRLTAIVNQVIRGEIPLDKPLRPGAGETLAIHTFGKGRAGTTWEEWKQRIDQELDELFEDCQPINRFKMQIPTDPIDPPATP